MFVIGPDKKIKLTIAYPMTTGRNFHEVLRAIDSLQMRAVHKLATPANCESGEDVIIAGSVSDDDAKKIYPEGWRAPKPYMRFVPPPAAAAATPIVRYQTEGVGTFEAPVEKIFRYMSAGNHPHRRSRAIASSA